MPTSPDPANEPAPSHEHWILYVVGSVSGTLGLWLWVGGQLEGRTHVFGRNALAFGAVAIVIGSLLHYRRIRLEAPYATPEAGHRPPASSQPLAVGLALWLGPLLFSWVQFELFRDPIAMFPLVITAGSCVVVWRLVQRFFASATARRILGPVLVAAVGVPLGMLSFVLPLRHFTHHLSSVEVWSYASEYETDDGPTVVGPDLPDMPAEPLIGSGTESMLEAIANAKVVEVNRLADGTLVQVDENGVPHPIEVTDGEALFAQMQTDADAQDEAERNARREAARKQREALRTSGRLFR